MDTSILELPKPFWELYERELKRNNLFLACQGGSKKNEIYGGNAEEEQKEHFCYRYPNNASRIFKIMDAECIETKECSIEILHSFLSHTISLIDFISGTGASGLSLILEICENRKKVALPQMPMRVNLYAIDISQHALDIYESMVNSANIHFKNHYIDVIFHKVCGDVFNPLFGNDFFTSNQNTILDSDVVFISATTSSVDIKENESSAFSHIIHRLSSAYATQLYIEPDFSKGRKKFTILTDFYDKIKKWMAKDNNRKYIDISCESLKYNWLHLIQKEDNIISGSLKCKIVRWNS